MIGYLIEKELASRLVGRRIATLLTQVVVDPQDAAFGHPTKPIGPVYEEAHARRLIAEAGWCMAADGAGFRRVVASPEPIGIREIATIRILVDAGVVVVCGGGGGIPVTVGADGAVRGIEAVIDKDRSSALLAREVGAEWLLILTDVAAIYDRWEAADRRAIRRAGPAALRALTFDPGSMGPKVEAVCRFVSETGGHAAVGALVDATAILRGDAGTTIAPTAVPLEWYPGPQGRAHEA
jgi:carbamate kinase